MSTIKAGYRITVVSWENDADNYNTCTVDGLDEQEARYHVDLLKLIKGSHCNDRSVFGNLYEPHDSEVEAFEEAIRGVFYKHGKSFPDDMALDVAMDTLGEYTGYGDGYTTRVAEKITVEHVPQEIFIEDVSKTFGV